MKKTLVILLCLILCLSVCFAACKKKTQDPDDSSDSDSVSDTSDTDTSDTDNTDDTDDTEDTEDTEDTDDTEDTEDTEGTEEGDDGETEDTTEINSNTPIGGTPSEGNGANDKDNQGSSGEEVVDPKVMYAVLDANVMKTADADAEVLKTLVFAEEIQTVSKKNEWYKIEWEDAEEEKTLKGYVHEDYLTDSKASITFHAIDGFQVYTVTTSATLYKSPSLFSVPASETLEAIPQGAFVTVKQVNETGDWYFISYNSVDGYCPSEWLVVKNASQNNGEPV